MPSPRRGDVRGGGGDRPGLSRPIGRLRERGVYVGLIEAQVRPPEHEQRLARAWREWVTLPAAAETVRL